MTGAQEEVDSKSSESNESFTQRTRTGELRPDLGLLLSVVRLAHQPQGARTDFNFSSHLSNVSSEQSQSGINRPVALTPVDLTKKVYYIAATLITAEKLGVLEVQDGGALAEENTEGAADRLCNSNSEQHV